jgi:hypothetical protein
VNDNSERYGRTVLKYYRNIFLEILRVSRRKSQSENHSPDRDSKPGPLKFEISVLRFLPRLEYFGITEKGSWVWSALDMGYEEKWLLTQDISKTGKDVVMDETDLISTIESRRNVYTRGELLINHMFLKRINEFP